MPPPPSWEARKQLFFSSFFSFSAAAALAKTAAEAHSTHSTPLGAQAEEEGREGF